MASRTGLILKRKREERDCGKRDDNEGWRWWELRSHNYFLKWVVAIHNFLQHKNHQFQTSYSHLTSFSSSSPSWSSIYLSPSRKEKKNTHTHAHTPTLTYTTRTHTIVFIRWVLEFGNSCLPSVVDDDHDMMMMVLVMGVFYFSLSSQVVVEWELSRVVVE